MKAGSGKTFGLKQATAHAIGIYDTPLLERWIYNNLREESAYSRPVNLPDSLSENEASHFPIILNIANLTVCIGKVMHFIQNTG